MKLEPCKKCKYLNRIKVRYVSYRCQCKLNKQLRVTDFGFDKPHPKCPLVLQGCNKSNLSLEWLKVNKPKEYEVLRKQL